VEATRYKYNCCQNAKRQHKPEKSDVEAKQRDKVQMDAFRCSGWLHITLFGGSETARNNRFIEKTFVPVGQSNEKNPVSYSFHSDTYNYSLAKGYICH
jgi:hypothetical protein